jgi:hypothetical protein
MASQQRYTLDSLTARAESIRQASQKNSGSSNGSYVQETVTNSHPVCPTVERERTVITKPNTWSGVTWFIVLALITGVLLFLLRPSILMSTDQQTGVKTLNWWYLILWSLGISLAIVLIINLVRGTSNQGNHDGYNGKSR